MSGILSGPQELDYRHKLSKTPPPDKTVEELAEENQLTLMNCDRRKCKLLPKACARIWWEVNKLKKNGGKFNSCYRCSVGQKLADELEAVRLVNQHFLCVQCGNEPAMLHPATKRPFKHGLGKECFKLRMAERRKKKLEEKGKVSEEKGKVSEEKGKVSEKKAAKAKDSDNILNIDFNSHPYLLRKLHEQAVLEMRTDEMQALWILKTVLEDVNNG